MALQDGTHIAIGQVVDLKTLLRLPGLKPDTRDMVSSIIHLSLFWVELDNIGGPAALVNTHNINPLDFGSCYHLAQDHYTRQTARVHSVS